MTDMFCGCGGSTQGAVGTGVEVKMALNHWGLAVETHNTNHPDTWHDDPNVSETRPDRYPRTDLLWASPECTNHSLAKGTKYQQSNQQDLFSQTEADPSAKRSRATMWDVVRYAEWHDYEAVIVENVPDARKWRLWDAWWKAMRDLGYRGQCLYLNSMFFPPTPQSRNRLYVVFWKEGNAEPDLEICPPARCETCGETVAAVQSWRDTGYGRRRIGLRYGQQYEYRCPKCSEVVKPFYMAAFNAIDFSIEAEKIGERSRPLADATMRRIQYGLEEYGRKPLVVTTRYTSGTSSRVRDAISEELPTQPTGATHGIFSPYFVETAHSQGSDTRAKGAGDALPTQSARRSMGMVQPAVLSKQYSTMAAAGMDDPVGSITTADHHAVVGLPMLTSVNDFDDRNIAAVEKPCGTQTTQTKWGVVRPPAFIAELHGTSDARGVQEPLMCVTAGGGNHALIDTGAFLSYYYGAADQVSGLDEPSGTVTTRDRAALVEAAENMEVEDCTFRMLQPHEIQAAMAFPSDYEVLGNKREQVKQLGNAVTPPVARVLVERIAESLDA